MTTLKTNLQRLLGLTVRGRGRLPAAISPGAIPAGRGVGEYDTATEAEGIASPLTEINRETTQERVYYSDSEGVIDQSFWVEIARTDTITFRDAAGRNVTFIFSNDG